MKIVLLFVMSIIGCVPMPIYKSPDTSNNQTSLSTKPTGVSNVVTAIAHPKIFDQDVMMKEIQTWMGTPYRFGMMEKGTGADCSGFVYSIFKKCVAIDLPRQASDMFAVGIAVEKSQMVFGDLIFFQNTYKGASGASHVGIFVGNGKMAHAGTTGGVMISDIEEPYYDTHFLGCRRLNP